MLISGKSPSIGTPTLWKTSSRPAKSWSTRTSGARRARRGGARACAGRGGAARARAPQWRRCGRGSSSPPLDEPQERGVEIAAPGAARARRACASARMPPSRRSSSRSQRAASSITWLETSSVVPPAASSWKKSQRSRRSTGSRPTVGSSRTSTSGSFEQRRRERHACPLATGEPPDEPARLVAETDPSDRRVDAVARDAEHAREVVEVLAHGEIAVDGGRLGHVRRAGRAAPASRPAAPSTVTSPPATTCTPTIARISVDLPLPLGPRRPVTAPPSMSTERSRRTVAPPRSTRRPCTSIVAAHDGSKQRAHYGSRRRWPSPFFSGADVERAVSPHEAYDAVKRGVPRLRARRVDDAAEALRTELPGGRLPRDAGARRWTRALKWVTSFPGNPARGCRR